MQILIFLMAFTNIVAILFFTLRYIARTIHEKRANRTYSSPHQEMHEELQLSM